MRIHINIETDIDTCVHCPFWAMDTAQNIQYCHYKRKDLDTSQTRHPPVPDWCPFIKDKHEPDRALMLYNNLREQFPEIIPNLLYWEYIGKNKLSVLVKIPETEQHAQGVYEYYSDRSPKLDFYMPY